MVDTRLLDAARAYGTQPLGKANIASPAIDTSTSLKTGVDFQNLLTEAVQSTMDVTKSSESSAMNVIAGKGDLVDVVTAVTNAEMAVETVVAVRDKVIQAYNDIIRMPM